MNERDVQRGVDRAVESIRARDKRVPELALILGSGLGSLADVASDPTVISGSEIPGFPSAGVSGHKGDLVIGGLAGVTAVFLRGRFHFYEGHPDYALTFPVRVASGLGARFLVVTNAAGSLREDVAAGTVMRITDHINLTRVNPLVGSTNGSTFRRGNTCFDLGWGTVADAIAKEQGVEMSKGVYLWTTGPSYETPAEIRFFIEIGADAVGMSTVPEVSLAARLGMKVLGFSAITNLAAGLENVILSHDDVLEVGKGIHDTMAKLILAVATSLPKDESVPE